MSKIITASFSGNPKTYSYSVPDTMTASKGDRVVVPVQIKKDGHLQLSICTVESEEGVAVDNMLPVLQVIPWLSIQKATELVKSIEAAT